MENVLAQPYYGDKKIRFYNTTNPIASSPLYSLDLSNDITTNWGSDFGPNSVVINNTKIFVAIANDNGDKGGVLIYDYANIYPTKNANLPVVSKFGIANGLSAAGMAVNPATGDLYVPTFHVSGSDGGIYEFTAASNYTTMNHFADFNDASVAEICANLAFDTKGNLWMTTWSPDNDPSHHFLICYKGLNKNNFYKITNTASKSYTAKSVGGTSINVHLLSAPEGIAFDASGNLWLGNNNDFALTNNAGEGTLVKISSGFISTMLSDAPGTFTIPATGVDIKYIPAGKPGGIIFQGNTIFINDQGQGQGSNFAVNGTVWKWDVNSAFNSSNFKASGIHTTYPGNGGSCFVQPFIYIQDNATDTGVEPNKTITQPWQSLDIWVRKIADGTAAGNDLTEDVTGGQPGFVYVKVRNKGMIASAGTEVLKLYWAKASSGLFRPAPWDSTINDPSTGKSMGGLIGSQTLPSIAAGDSYIAGFTGWTTPNPNEYTNTDGHFCLLARIESTTGSPYGMTYPEANNEIVKNALNNNRIGWRNIHIVNPVTMKMQVGGGVITANFTEAAMRASLSFELLNADGVAMNTGNGSLLITAKGTALEKLQHTEYDRQNVESLGNGVFRIANIQAGIENIMLQPGEMLQLQVAYKIDEKLTGAALRVIQYQQDDAALKLIGGQTFIYGKVKGFPVAQTKPRKTNCLFWIIGLIVVAAVLIKKCKD